MTIHPEHREIFAKEVTITHSCLGKPSGLEQKVKLIQGATLSPHWVDLDYLATHFDACSKWSRNGMKGLRAQEIEYKDDGTYFTTHRLLVTEEQAAQVMQRRQELGLK